MKTFLAIVAVLAIAAARPEHKRKRSDYNPQLHYKNDYEIEYEENGKGLQQYSQQDVQRSGWNRQYNQQKQSQPDLSQYVNQKKYLPLSVQKEHVGRQRQQRVGYLGHQPQQPVEQLKYNVEPQPQPQLVAGLEKHISQPDLSQYIPQQKYVPHFVPNEHVNQPQQQTVVKLNFDTEHQFPSGLEKHVSQDVRPYIAEKYVPQSIPNEYVSHQQQPTIGQVQHQQSAEQFKYNTEPQPQLDAGLEKHIISQPDLSQYVVQQKYVPQPDQNEYIAHQLQQSVAQFDYNTIQVGDLENHERPTVNQDASQGSIKVYIPRILEYKSENNGHSYHYAYHTENGITASEVGQTVGKDNQVEGSYSFVGDDGKTYTVNYVADENGFRAQGDHLPTPPPTPQAILESLEKNAHDEVNGIHDDGKYQEQQIVQSNEQEYHQEAHHPQPQKAPEHNGYYH